MLLQISSEFRTRAILQVSIPPLLTSPTSSLITRKLDPRQVVRAAADLEQILQIGSSSLRSANPVEAKQDRDSRSGFAASVVSFPENEHLALCHQYMQARPTFPHLLQTRGPPDSCRRKSLCLSRLSTRAVLSWRFVKKRQRQASYHSHSCKQLPTVAVAPAVLGVEARGNDPVQQSYALVATTSGGKCPAGQRSDCLRAFEYRRQL